MRILPACCLLTLALVAGGCSSRGSPWSQYFQLTRQSFSGGRNQGISREQAAAVPYASLGYRLNGGTEMMLVLATDNNDDQIWTAASHVVLLTRGGRIARSVGLSHDRGGLEARSGDALPPLSDALKGPYRSTRLIDLPDMGIYSVPLNCLTSARGAQTITILGASIATVRVDETCQSASPRWSFTDNFWLDAQSGFVWHSVQHLHPAGTTVQVEILRPPG